MIVPEPPPYPPPLAGEGRVGVGWHDRVSEVLLAARLQTRCSATDMRMATASAAEPDLTGDQGPPFVDTRLPGSIPVSMGVAGNDSSENPQTTPMHYQRHGVTVPCS